MAIDGTYSITADVGGKKTGMTEIVSDGETVWVKLDAPIIGTIEGVGSMVDEDTFSVSGQTRVLLKRIKYTITARVLGDDLIAVCETNMGTADVVGKRIL